MKQNFSELPQLAIHDLIRMTIEVISLSKLKEVVDEILRTYGPYILKVKPKLHDPKLLNVTIHGCFSQNVTHEQGKFLSSEIQVKLVFDSRDMPENEKKVQHLIYELERSFEAIAQDPKHA